MLQLYVTGKERADQLTASDEMYSQQLIIQVFQISRMDPQVYLLRCINECKKTKYFAPDRVPFHIIRSMFLVVDGCDLLPLALILKA
jgi:hypothetical protein